MSRVKHDLSQHTAPTEVAGSSLDMLRMAAAKGRQISVGIVGAGFAGLRCADVLLQYGFKVTIFEARNRVGGRVAQSNHLGHLVDLGPNWIHGTNDNPIMQIAKATGTQLHAWDETQAVLDSSGQPLASGEASEYAQLFWDHGVIADAFRYSNEQSDSIPVERSLYDFFQEKAEDMFSNLPADVAKRKRRTFLQMASMWGSYVGSPITKQSLKFFWLEQCIEGENAFVAETYNKILDHVAKPALHMADVRLNTKVTSIVSARTNNVLKPAIKTANGSREDFDEVVVTTPLGWLKRNQHAFEPFLEPRLAQAIENIGYGALDKIYVTFPSAFWESLNPEKCCAPNGLDPEGKTPNVAAATIPLHQPTPSGSSSHYPGYTHWLSPRYDQNNPQRWDQQGMNMAALPNECAHPTLLFYIYGDCSKHVAKLINTVSPEQVDATLVEFLEPYFSRLPNYSAENVACKPRAVLATAWAADEFAGYGSYSNFQVGLQAGDEDIEVMRHGMPERCVWFAGEHTAPFVALGTSTGAYWSGEGVAKRIAKGYGLID